MNCPFCQKELREYKNFSLEKCMKCNKLLIFINRPYPVYFSTLLFKEGYYNLQYQGKTIEEELCYEDIIYIPFWYEHATRKHETIIPYTSSLINKISKKGISIVEDKEPKWSESDIMKVIGPIYKYNELEEVMLIPLLRLRLSERNGEFLLYHPEYDDITSIPLRRFVERLDKSWIIINIVNLVIFLIVAFFTPIWVSLPLLFITSILINLWRLRGKS